MSKGVNRVIIIGNVGQDPDVRYGQSGSAVTRISVATSESWKDKKTGQTQEHSEWHRVVFFGKLAEIVGEYVRKGSKLYIEGSLRTQKWQDQQGNDRYTTEIVAKEMQMLDSRGESQGQQQAAQPRQNHAQGQHQESHHHQGHYQSSQPQQAPQQDAFDDDSIPF